MTDDEQKPIIEASENGPLVVKNLGKNLGKILNADGSDAGVKPVMALCRCGASKNKPFCDGAHMGIEFSSSLGEACPRDKLYNYEGAEITVHYNPLLCSHAARCGAMLKPVFDGASDPWIMPDNGSVEDIKAVVGACPSGALSFSEKGGEPCHIEDGECVIEIEVHGPYHVRNVELKGAKWGTEACREKYVLCRCGLSKNKPFCDGAHGDAGWRDDAE